MVRALLHHARRPTLPDHDILMQAHFQGSKQPVHHLSWTRMQFVELRSLQPDVETQKQDHLSCLTRTELSRVLDRRLFHGGTRACNTALDGYDSCRLPGSQMVLF